MIGKRTLILLVAALGLPSLANAVPSTWNYSGACTWGDCGVVPTLTGTLTGDPAIVPPSNEINEYLLPGDVSSYSFSLGGYAISGTTAFGTYYLDAGGNITGGSMVFGNLLSLEFLGVGSSEWAFLDENCVWFECYTAVKAGGTGGYSTAVPEPGALALLGGGLIAFAWGYRRRRPA